MGIPKVSDPSKIVTDPVVLDELARQGIDSNYVEFFEDYSTKYPTAKFYRDLKSGTRLGVFSGLPMVTPTGEKVVCGWTYHNDTYFSKVNTFTAQVTGNEITVDGTRWSPQLFLDGKEIQGKDAILLDIDPTNENYLQNVLEWDYGICKRRLRIIEGRIRETWTFTQDPKGEVVIKHNHTGKLRLGSFAINDDEELVTKEYFANPEYGYPVIVGASPETFYSATNDGYVRNTNAVWLTCRNAAAGDASDNVADQIAVFSYWNVATGYRIFRGFLMINTAGLPDDCTITAAALSIYGNVGKVNEDDAGHADTCLYEGTQGDAIAVGDFDEFGTTLLTAGSYSYEFPIVTNDYTAASLNAAGLALINKTGTTYYAFRTLGDVTPLTPTGTNQQNFFSFDKGAGFKPKLVVTYTISVTVSPPIADTANAVGYDPQIFMDYTWTRDGDGGANFHHGRRVRTHSEKLITGNFDTYSSWTFE